MQQELLWWQQELHFSFFVHEHLDVFQFVFQEHFTYPWSPVYLITDVLRANSTLGTSSGVRIFSLAGSKSAVVYQVVMRPSMQPTWYKSLSRCITTTRRFLLSHGQRSNSGTFKVALSPNCRALKRCFALLVILTAVFSWLTAASCRASANCGTSPPSCSSSPSGSSSGHLNIQALCSFN